MVSYASTTATGNHREAIAVNLRPDQLESHLAGTLRPVYIVSGDEPLQHAEVADAIRAAARRQGHSAREVHEAGSDFDWGALAEAGANLSLFGDRVLVDLRLPTGKPGREGARVLKEWGGAPPPDTLLLVTAPKLDRQTQQSAWYKALAAAGAAVTVALPPRGRLGHWIEARMRTRGLQADAEAVSLLAERVEGNLVAAAHEIDKLLLLQGPGAVDAATVRSAVADSSRYTPFDLANAIVAGEAARVGRIAAGLRGEGVAEPLALWAVHREIDLLASAAARCVAGESVAGALRAAGVWPSRQEALGRALHRHTAADWAALLARCARLDRVAKGAERGSFWEELVELALLAAGARMTPLTPVDGPGRAA